MKAKVEFIPYNGDGEEVAQDHPDATKWGWHVKARNGEIVSQGESHNSEADALRAFLSAHKAMDEAFEALRNEGAPEPV